MAINVNAANTQADQLNNNITKLRDAKRQMQTYKSSVSGNWQGKEVTYIMTAIDQVIGEIDSAIRNLETLGPDIRNTAAQIKREEDAAAAAAAAARAQAAKQQRIRAAQEAHDSACNELNKLADSRNQLEKKLKKANFWEKIRIMADIQELNNAIAKAEERVRSTAEALQVAKR